MKRASIKRRRTLESPRRSASHWLQVSLLVFLGISSLALTYIAYVAVGSSDHPGLPTRAAEQRQVVDVVDPAPETQPEPENIELASVQRSLTIVDELVVARTTSGSCEQPGTIEFSGDGGLNWTVSEDAGNGEMTEILHVITAGRSLVDVIALDSNCEPALFRTTNLGGSWSGPDPTEEAWYIEPLDPTVISTRSGTATVDCSAAHLATGVSRAAVLCSDNTLITTEDSGASWQQVPDISTAVAVGPSDIGVVTALSDDPECDGLRLLWLSGENPARPDGCLPAERNTATEGAVDTALAQSGDTVIVWTGDDLAISNDGGISWY